MKVLICHRPGGAFGYISDSWLNAFRDSGFTAERWDGKPSTWNKFKPDLYIGCSGHRQHIPSRHARKTKVAIHVNPYGPIKVQPNINESQDAINWVHSMMPDVVFGYGFEEHRKYWSDWKNNFHIQWVPMPTAGDITMYRPGSNNKLDFAYVGGYWAYKAKNIDKYLIPLLEKQLNFKVRGWGWKTAKTDAVADTKECSNDEKISLLQSATIGPCVSEPHTTKHGIDLPERVFKVILSGAIAVHDPVDGLANILDSVLVATDPEDYVDNIQKLLESPEGVKQRIWQFQYDEVFNKHTYHHRLANLLKVMGFTGPANKMLDRVGRHYAL